MSRLIACGFLCLLLAAVSPTDAAAVPYVAVYYDAELTQTTGVCQGLGVIDTLYIAAGGFDTPVEGIEFKMTFPPDKMTWLGGVDLGNSLKLGYAADGISIAFFEPVDASSPVVIHAVIIYWLCDECDFLGEMITVDPHPATGSIGAVTSDLTLLNPVGLPAIVCPMMNSRSDPGEVVTTYAAPAADQAAAQCVLECPAGDGGEILPGTLPAEIHNPDLDGDGAVALPDLAEFATYYHNSFDPDMDFYCSGAIDLVDFVLFTRHWEHSGSLPVESTTWGHIKTQFTE